MTKIVYNGCYGGFSLSNEAIMSADVERVARIVCAILHGAADGYDVWDAIGEADRQKCRQIAAPAMAETRLIDADACRKVHRSLPGWTIANWLTARTKETTDGIA
jgi:uncharacterized protein (DUF1501 family)